MKKTTLILGTLALLCGLLLYTSEPIAAVEKSVINVINSDQVAIQKNNLTRTTAFLDKNFQEENKGKVLSEKRIQGLFFQLKGSSQWVTYLTQETFNQVTKIKLAYYEGNSEEFLPTYVQKNNDTLVKVNGFTVASKKHLGNTNNELTTYLAKKLSDLKMDDLFAKFGGRQTMDVAFAKSSLVLGDYASGEKTMDAYQLDTTYEKIQEDPTTAQHLVDLFADFSTYQSQDDTSKKEIKKYLGTHIEEILFLYTYMQRWYNYEIGGVNLADLIFAKSNFFSEDVTLEDRTAFNHLLVGFHDDPWPEVPGEPAANALLQEAALFGLEDMKGLRGNKLGFDLASFNDFNSMIEYLIRTFTNSTDYNNWFKQQGFTLAESQVDADFYKKSGIKKKDYWELLKEYSKIGSPWKVNSSVIGLLLALPDRSQVLIGNALQTIIFSYKEREYVDVLANNNTPQKAIQKFVNDNDAFVKFLWNTGDANTRESLKEKNIGAVIDSGELGRYSKDPTNSDHQYLYYFLQPFSPYYCAGGTRWVNAYVEDNSVIMGLNDLSNEFTIQHEQTHRYMWVLNGGYGLRVHIEHPAVLTEGNSNTKRLTFNYYHEDAITTNYNNRVFTTNEEVKKYTNNALTMMYIWNLIEAKQVFQMSIKEQSHYVYQMVHEGNQLIIKKLSTQRLKELAFDPSAPDFIEKLVKNKIVLKRSEEDTIEFVSDLNKSNYDYVTVLDHAQFYIGTTGIGENYISGINQNSVGGQDHLWMFEMMSQKGMDGYRDYVGKRLGLATDEEVIKKITGKNPIDYLITRYQEIDKAINENNITGVSLEKIKKDIATSLTTDNTSLKLDQFKQTLAATDNFQEDLIVEVNEPLTTPEVEELTNQSQKLKGRADANVAITVFEAAGEQKIANAKTDAEGNFVVHLPKCYPVGTKLLVIATKGNQTSEKAEVIVVNKDPEENVVTFTKLTYHLGESILTGKYTGKIKNARLYINGRSISWGGTFKEGTMTYLVVPNLIKAGDIVTLSAYGSEVQLINRDNPVEILK